MEKEKDNKKEVLKVLRELKMATANQIAGKVGIHYFTAERILTELHNEGKVQLQRSLINKYTKTIYYIQDKIRKDKMSVNEDTKTK